MNSNHLLFFVLKQILIILRSIMATQQELANSLNQVNQTLVTIASEVDKIGNETQGLLQKIVDLQNAINNSGNSSPEVDAALQAVKASAQSVSDKVTNVDNLVPDAPVGPDTSTVQG